MFTADASHTDLASVTQQVCALDSPIRHDKIDVLL